MKKSSISKTFCPFPTETEEQEITRLDILDNLTDNRENVKLEFNRTMMLARKYGYDEYADTLARLAEKIDYFRKGGR